MSNLLLVSVDAYKTHQYLALVNEYRGLIAVGLDYPHYLDAARLKWGLDPDSGHAAYIEAGDI